MSQNIERNFILLQLAQQFVWCSDTDFIVFTNFSQNFVGITNIRYSDSSQIKSSDRVSFQSIDGVYIVDQQLIQALFFFFFLVLFFCSLNTIEMLNVLVLDALIVIYLCISFDLMFHSFIILNFNSCISLNLYCFLFIIIWGHLLFQFFKILDKFLVLYWLLFDFLVLNTIKKYVQHSR